MKKTLKTSVLTLILLISFSLLISCQTIEKANVPITEKESQIYTTQIENGLTITIKESSNLPLVTIQFWVKTGSINENDKNRGVSHMFEHIWFKGTERQPAGIFDKKIASLGGYANAMTGQDFTVFYTIVPSEKLEETIDLMTDLFKNQAFDPEEIEKEREVILEEQKIIYNSPKRYSDEEFAKLLLLEHPYRHPILGYEETIRSLTEEKIKEYYKKWYAPNNMNLIIIGDVKKEEAVEYAKKYLGDLKRKELPNKIYPKEEEQKEIRYKTESRKGLENSYLSLGYRTADFRNQDWYSLRVLTQILDGAENSRLTKKLKTEKKLIISSETHYILLRDIGAIETMAVIQPEKETEAIQAIIDEYNRFKEEKVSEEELDSAKKQLQAGYARQQEEIIMQGIDLGIWWTSGIFEKQPYYLNEINKITAEDIMNAAKKYFKQPTIFVLRPE
jgi:zinc protease